MFFDGTFKRLTGTQKEDAQDNIIRIKILFVLQDNALIPYPFSLTKRCSNNTAEYEATIAWIELALQIPIPHLTIYGDSELIVKQPCKDLV